MASYRLAFREPAAKDRRPNFNRGVALIVHTLLPYQAAGLRERRGPAEESGEVGDRGVIGVCEWLGCPRRFKQSRWHGLQ